MVHYKELWAKRRAAKNIVKVYSGALDEDSACEINAWNNREESYGREFVRNSHLYDSVDSLRGDSELLDLAEEYLNTHRRPKREALLTKWQWSGIAVAASFLLVLGLVIGLSKNDDADNTVLRYTTRVGEVKSINLDDGSQVTLNTATEIRVSFSGENRQISLERGEIYLDVSKDAARPFSVNVGFHTISVLGTEFGVRRFPGKITVSVAEGLVSVHASEDAVLNEAPLIQDGSLLASSGQVRVPAGMMAELDFNRQQLRGHILASSDKRFSWRSGELEFVREPLYLVIQELNRYSGKKILIEDSGIVDLKVTAIVDISRIDLTLSGLEKSLPLKVTQYFDRISLTRSE